MIENNETSNINCLLLCQQNVPTGVCFIEVKWNNNEITFSLIIDFSHFQICLKCTFSSTLDISDFLFKIKTLLTTKIICLKKLSSHFSHCICYLKFSPIYLKSNWKCVITCQCHCCLHGQWQSSCKKFLLQSVFIEISEKFIFIPEIALFANRWVPNLRYRMTKHWA